MEQGRPTFEDGDEMKTRKQIASGGTRAAIESAGVLRPQSPSERATAEYLAQTDLVDLSVDDVGAARLKRLRWRAAVQVVAPFGVTLADEERLAGAVDAKLVGRRPLTCLHGNTLVTSFSVLNANDETRKMVDEFAARLSHLEHDDLERPRVVVSTITYTDLSDFEMNLPDDMREEAYVGGL